MTLRQDHHKKNELQMNIDRLDAAADKHRLSEGWKVMIERNGFLGEGYVVSIVNLPESAKGGWRE